METEGTGNIVENSSGGDQSSQRTVEPAQKKKMYNYNPMIPQIPLI